MKKFLMTISIISLCNALSAQTIETANVPASITTAFNSTFSTVEKVNWETDYDNYIAKFKSNKIEIAVTYSKDGKWISTETPVTHSSLPAAVKSCLTKQFDIYKENDIEKIESSNGVSYAIDLEYNQMNYEVVISEKGELLKKVQVKEYKKD